MMRLNLLLDTTKFFDTIITRDDFIHYIMIWKYKIIYYYQDDVILANEPMGLKNIIHASCCNRIKRS